MSKKTKMFEQIIKTKKEDIDQDFILNGYKTDKEFADDASFAVLALIAMGSD